MRGNPSGAGRTSQMFNFKASTVAAVFASKVANNGKASDFGKRFGMTITGADKVENLTAELVITSGAGVEASLKSLSTN